MTAPTEPSPQQRIDEWVERDRVVGLAAENHELRVRLTTMESEIADLRARSEQLVHRLAQSEAERLRLSRQAERSSLVHRGYRKLRRTLLPSKQP